jgi:carbon monoxide dehydrogenase subunit G
MTYTEQMKQWHENQIQIHGEGNVEVKLLLNKSGSGAEFDEKFSEEFMTIINKMESGELKPIEGSMSEHIANKFRKKAA